MKPIIDDLYKHGKLLHDNGQAYTEAEYNGITYAQTMSQMFTDLIKHVQDLIDAINGMVLHDKTFNITPHYTGGNSNESQGEGDPGELGPGGHPKPEHEHHQALGLNRWVLPGEPAMRFAEAGRPEYVYASSNGPPQAQAPAQSAQQQMSGVMVLEIDGQQFRAFLKRKQHGGYLGAA
jgi:hypothetical protein